MKRTIKRKLYDKGQSEKTEQLKEEEGGKKMLKQLKKYQDGGVTKHPKAKMLTFKQRQEVRRLKREQRQARGKIRQADRQAARAHYKTLTGTQKMAGTDWYGNVYGLDTPTGFRAGRYGHRALFGTGRVKRVKEKIK